ncbi:MAG TPA: M3 family oligoendopeptidase [Anaerolineaceae bacterium]|nr:M3 family oligoendopeptidase [Anaerolineaceae bacterium]HPN51511.1 M3 family oligoendopeptidase [Anaerolineaceae bacterium]
MSKKSYIQAPWSLDELVPAPQNEHIESLFKQIEDAVSAFTAVREQLKSDLSAEAFNGLLDRLEKIYNLAQRLSGYANLLFSGDTQNETALNLLPRVEMFMAEQQNQMLFFELWWKGLDDENAARLMAAAGDRTYWLEDMRHFKKHTLSEGEEKIINIKNVTGFNATNTLYDTITNRYEFSLKVDGQVKKMTRGELMVYARHHDGDLRARAYRQLYKVYGNDGPILGQIYQTLVRDWYSENVVLRHFDTPISNRNLVNDIPDAVVNTLLNVCKKNTGVFQRYFRLKARWLGVEKLRRYDLYAPVAKSDKHYPFETAVQMVLDSFADFDPKLAELVQRVLDEAHVDSEVRKGKRGGAFCATVTPELSPWVHLNFQGHADDVATAAHEMGHAIHALLANQHSVFTQHACLPLAETASTFGEMLLIDRILATDPNEGVRRDLLFRQIDDAYATIQRQAFFALFEVEAHEMICNGASVNDLCTAYMKNLRKQFGGVVSVSREFQWEWVSIPHIYNVPFYVYAYTFGQLLVLSLYQQYRKEGEAFKPRYLKLLAAGGSAAPMTLLAQMGLDASKADFWQGGFDYLSSKVDELEALPIPQA